MTYVGANGFSRVLLAPGSYRLLARTADTVSQRVSEIANTIAAKSPVSTRMGKHTLNVIEDLSLRDGYRYEQDMTAQIGKTADAKEAQLAFAEKRKPDPSKFGK